MPAASHAATAPSTSLPALSARCIITCAPPAGWLATAAQAPAPLFLDLQPPNSDASALELPLRDFSSPAACASAATAAAAAAAELPVLEVLNSPPTLALKPRPRLAASGERGLPPAHLVQLPPQLPPTPAAAGGGPESSPVADAAAARQ
jgi:hypothetical protein